MMPGWRQNPTTTRPGMPWLKKLFWLYYLLLIFEGALRKWVVPELSAPLLLVRDPIALLILWEAYRARKWPEKWSLVMGILTAAMIGLCVLQMVTGGNPWFAALYGLRSYLLPFPVAFIMGENLEAEDLRKFGVFTLWLLLPMTALEAAQYLAPAESFLNAGAYQGASQINYVFGHVRASGTFSFATGPIGYGPLAAAFIFYGLAREKFAPKWLLWSATAALIFSVPVIGARTLVFELSATLVCVGIAAIWATAQFAKALKIIVPGLLLAFLVSFLPIFTMASSSLAKRFLEANALEGGTVRQVLIYRTITPIVRRLEETDFMSNPIGKGMGQGAAAITKLTTGAVQFTAGEFEFSREMVELGPFPGIAFLLFRVILALLIFTKALSQAHNKEPLALLLSPLLLSALLLETLEQPTDQGFMVIALAFSLAALKRGSVLVPPTPASQHFSRPLRYSGPGQ